MRAGKNQRRCKVYLHLRRIVHGGLRCTHAVATLQRTLDACTGDDAGARFWLRRWSLAGGGPGQTRAPRMILRLLRAKLKRLRSQQQPSPHCACGLHVIAPPPPDAAGALDWMLSPQGNWQQRQQQADAGMAWQSMAARPSATAAAACTQASTQASLWLLPLPSPLPQSHLIRQKIRTAPRFRMTITPSHHHHHSGMAC